MADEGDKINESQVSNRAAGVKAWGQALFGGGFASGAFAIVSVVAATLSGAWAAQADRAFERHQAERQEQLVIYERIEKQLGTGTPSGIVIASSYVDLVEKANIKQALCETVASVALSHLNAAEASKRPQYEAALQDVAQTMRECTVRLAEGEAIADDAAGEASPSADQVREIVQEEISVDTVVRPYSANPKGYDIDVFACEGGGAESRKLAQQAADWLAAKDMIGEFPIGRVRMRTASEKAQKKLAPAAGNPVVGTADEKQLAELIAAGLSRPGGARFFYSPTQMQTQWYVSVFACEKRA